MFEMMASEKHGFYVDFELRPEEDREQSIEQGMPVYKDVEYAVITMPGGGLVVDKVITENLLREWRYGDNMRKPASPFAFSEYEAWKDGREAGVDGTDLKNWPGVTPAQLKMCLNATIKTVEHLAEANADTLRKIGMGAVALKEKAAAYLGAAQTNKASEAVVALRVEMDGLKDMIATRDDQIAKLQESLDTKKIGRPKKQAVE